jgi:hypothetical protein
MAVRFSAPRRLKSSRGRQVWRKLRTYRTNTNLLESTVSPACKRQK